GTALYWAIHLGFFSGARLGEISQLYLDDIKQVDDVWCIHIQRKREDQKLKTPSSERFIPLHKTILSLGFLVYCKNLKKLGEKRLFPTLSYLPKSGYNRNLSYLFNNVLLKELGLKNEKVKKDFHSLRHTFIDLCMKAQIEETFVQAIVGHRQSNITYGRYGKGYPPDVLRDKLDNVNFGFMKWQKINKFIECF
ncbi:MAG: site-specific integrase, partial [Bacteroidetes bacterium]|nr:site-specific integrase [Bacteroidota bacterium]